jgi:hypothetical protein
MHTLNRISSDDHYYLTPNEQRKAAEVLMRASEQGELDYALGSLIQWGAKKLGRSVSDKQKEAIDTFAKKAIPAVGDLATQWTGNKTYKNVADAVGDNYDRIEPAYKVLKSGYSWLKDKLSNELDYESAERLVTAVDKTLNTIKQSPHIRTAKQVQNVFGNALNAQSSVKGTWYRLADGKVLLKGAGQ